MTSDRRSDLKSACALLLLAAAFWAPWVARGNVPVPGDQQTWMLPWAAAAFPERDPAGWDAFWWDGVAQFYPWRLELHRELAHGRWPLWTDARFCGYPFVGNGQSAMFYPPNWLYAAAHPARGFALLAAAHFGLAALLTFAFCRRIGLGRAGAGLAGIAFAFGGFMVGLTPLPTLMNSAAWLPGCLLGVEMVMRGGGPRSVAFLALCVGMTILAGHLQIAAYVLLATALYAASRVGHALWRRRPPRLAALVASAALGLTLGAAQLLPSVELGGLSPRGAGAASAEAFEGFHLPRALQPAELATLAFPDALGSPARGDYRGMQVAPGAAYGERCGYVGLLTLVLAAAGMVFGKRWWRWAFFAAAVLALWAAMGGPPARVVYFGVPKVGLTGGFTRLLCLYTFFAAVLGGLGLDALLRRMRGRSGGRLMRVIAVAALALPAVELFAWGLRTLPAAPAERLYARTGATDYLQEHTRPGERILAVTSRDAWTIHRRPEALFPPNSASAYEGLASVQGYDSLFPRSFDRLAVMIEQGPRSPVTNGNLVLLENVASPLLDVAGVRRVLTRARGDDGEGIVLNGVRITERPGAFPRTFLAEPPLARGPGALRALARAGPSAPAEVRFHGGSALEAQAPARDAPADLVITNTLYPGWRAWVDGEAAPVGSVDGVFQAVALPAGEPCRVLLAFVPGAVVVGMFLMLCAAGTIVGMWCFERQANGRLGTTG